MSLVGIVTVFALAWLISDNRRRINYRTVGVAFALQVALAALILYVPSGDTAFTAMANAVQKVIDYGYVGVEFLLGELGTRKPHGFIIAFHVLPVIVFFAALMAVLYYIGIMQWVVSILGGWLHKLLQTSRAESISAAANIFLGHTESPLVVRPYLRNMTDSELFAVMTVGMATIAGSVMAAYATMGVSLKYLITASFMGAPGGLMMSKMVKPETDYRDPNVLTHAQFGDHE